MLPLIAAWYTSHPISQSHDFFASGRGTYGFVYFIILGLFSSTSFAFSSIYSPRIGVKFHASICISTTPPTSPSPFPEPFCGSFQLPSLPFLSPHVHACSVRVPSLDTPHFSCPCPPALEFRSKRQLPTFFTRLSASTLRCSQIMCTTYESTLA